MKFLAKNIFNKSDLHSNRSNKLLFQNVKLVLLNMKYFIDQALACFHSWLYHDCPQDIYPRELIEKSDEFYPNLLQHSDSLGRNILHLLASYGPEWPVEMILKSKVCSLTPDFENGWNAAHRSAYFGQIFTLRSLYNYSPELFDLTDRCGYTAIDILISQSSHKARFSNYQKGQCKIIKTGGVLQTWGQNQNYTLGSGSEAARRYPEKISLSSKETVVHASFSKYHGL